MSHHQGVLATCLDDITIAKPEVTRDFYQHFAAWPFAKRLFIVGLYNILAFSAAYHLIAYRRMYNDTTPSLGLRFKVHMHGHCCRSTTSMQVASCADDIRTVVTSPESLEDQVTMMNTFASENFLSLNINKCEIVPFSHSKKSGQQPTTPLWSEWCSHSSKIGGQMSWIQVEKWFTCLKVQLREHWEGQTFVFSLRTYRSLPGWLKPTLYKIYNRNMHSSCAAIWVWELDSFKQVPWRSWIVHWGVGEENFEMA